MKIKVYTLSEHTDTDCIAIGTTYLNRDEAIAIAEDHISDYQDVSSNVMLTEYVVEPDQEIIDEIVELLEVEPGSDDFKEYFVENYNWDEYEIWQEQKDEIIKEYGAVNEDTDQLIDEVIDKLNDHFADHGIVNRLWKKYTSLYVNSEGNLTTSDTDCEGFENKLVNIRIADHTHNPSRSDNDLTIVICNDDATFQRFHNAHTDLYFNSDYSADEIIDQILNFWK